MAFATIDVTKGITGTIPVANGGTGITSGTTDQFLKFTGTTTIASAADNGGAWTLLQTQDASSSSTISFTSVFDTTYDVYKFILHGIVVGTDDAAITIAASGDGGSNYNVQGYCGLSYFATTSGGVFSTATGQPNAAGAIAIGYYGSDVAASDGFNSQITIYNPVPDTETMAIIATAQRSSQNKFLNESGVIRWNQDELNAFQFAVSTGNIASGTFKLYGLVKT